MTKHLLDAKKKKKEREKTTRKHSVLKIIDNRFSFNLIVNVNQVGIK